MIACGHGKGIDWELRLSRCKLLHIGWINNKVPLYHTGNHIQYLIIANNVKESQKQYTLTCITESLSAVYLKHNIVNELCFN